MFTYEAIKTFHNLEFSTSHIQAFHFLDQIKLSW